MSLVHGRCLQPALLFLFASSAPLLFGDATASVTVQTFLTGANPCQLTSSGAPIQCVSGTPGTPPNAVANGSASAGPGSLSLSLAVGGTGGNAIASAAASYNYELFFPGAASGTVVDRYTVNASAAGNLG